MGFIGHYSAHFNCDCCSAITEVSHTQTRAEALTYVQEENSWQLKENGEVLCSDCKAKNELVLQKVENLKPVDQNQIAETKPEMVWNTIKVTCQRCGHYLSGCHCNHFGSSCPHLNISEFNDNGIAECFNCKRNINRDRDVVWI